VTLIRRNPLVKVFVLARAISWIQESLLALRQVTEMEETR
jgi:hypothetical protein